LGRRAADVDALASTSTEVEIFGAVYHVRGGDDREHLQELADLVDGKMREIAQHMAPMAPMATADPARIAILTALNLADELFRTEKRQEGERVEIREKMAILTEELDSALRS
jgi:cell division protein ZapA